MEKEYSVTRDFLTLPAEDEINELIKKDAGQIATKIKEGLAEQVKGNRGIAKVKRHIPNLYKGLVVNEVAKWANLFGYSFITDGEIHCIQLEKIKNVNGIKCSTCNRKRLSVSFIVREITAALSTIGILTALNFAPYLFESSPLWYIGTIPLSIVGIFVVCGIGCDMYNQLKQYE